MVDGQARLLPAWRAVPAMLIYTLLSVLACWRTMVLGFNGAGA